MLGLRRPALTGARLLRPATVQAPRRHRAMAAAAADADATGSFISRFRLEGAGSGPLAGVTVAVKDLFDVAGHATGFGNPVWLQTHAAPAAATAPPVAALLAAGGVVVGKTHMDELAYSLNGENAHYGTPTNVAAPGRIPGGSSSGSAAAVAAGQADVGLGSDTGGSVRVPASYCGLYGIRPSHGRISLAHARPLAPSFDTVGWFTRDAELLRRVGRVLLAPPSGDGCAAAPLGDGPLPVRWLVAKDAFSLAQPATGEAIYGALSGASSGAVKGVLGEPTEVEVAGAALAGEGLELLGSWMEVFRVTQAHEIWRTHGAWVSGHAPRFGPGVADRFRMASGISDAEFAAADAKRARIAAHVRALLGDDGLLALPTAPGPAVPLDTPAAQLDDWRRSLISLTAIAGLSGLPQVSLPFARVEGLPVGLSLIGPPGGDELLLQAAVRLAAALGQE
ncbi:AMI1 [Scenedesmus sp. PABB004]|nr:AMI1 [Scenedesmus sp. PABB004]